jgi:membrane protease YdiL (CAAX protease family)
MVDKGSRTPDWSAGEAQAWGEPQHWAPQVGPPGGTGPSASPGHPSPTDEVKNFNWFSADPQTRIGRMRFDSGKGSHWVAGILFWGVVAFLGLNTLTVLIDFAMGGALTGEVELSATLVWVNGVLLLVGFTVPPLVWVAAFYQGGWRAWGHALFLRFHQPLLQIGLGVLGALGMLVLALLVGLLLSLVGYDPENPVVEELAGFVTWPLVFWIALTAAIGEEVFFRGFLQPRVGIVLSAVLFGFLHLSYGVPLQVIMPLAFGFLLSALVVWTRSLVPAVVAHFGYNFGVGALLIAGRELGEFDFILVLLGLSS